MNYLTKDFDSIETGFVVLKDAVSRRNLMCGDMYWTMLNDDCLEIADKLTSMGADKNKIAAIGGWELRR